MAPVSNLRSRQFVAMAGAMGILTARHISDIKRSSAIRRLSQPPIVDPNPRPNEIFRFFDLPAELRNRIYSMATVRKDPISLDYGYICRRAANLMAANTQMRSEVANIYYGDNTFIFDVYASKLFLSRVQYGVDTAVTSCARPGLSSLCRPTAIVRTNVVKTIESLDLDHDRVALSPGTLGWIMPLG